MEKVDIVVFGATGFTGKCVVKHLARMCKEKYSDLTWAIAGRSEDKLQNLLKEIEEIDTSTIPIIKCDINDEKSLHSLTRRSRVLMNCTGPYTVLGEPVVKACIENGTHYVDISAELHHMLTIYRKYNKAAEEANVLIVTACGFGSLPCVMGLMHLRKHFRGTLHTVECYTEIDIPRRAYIPGCNKCLVHYGTWASLVYELQNFREYNEIKKKTFPKPLLDQPEPEEIKRSFFHKRNGRVWYPYPGPDRDIVEMTQRYLHEKKDLKPLHFKIYTTMPLLFHFFIIVPAFFIYYYASCYFACFRKLLWRFPGFFTMGYMSHKGPSEEMMNDTKFSFTLTGKGWDQHSQELKGPPNKTLTLKVTGSNPGYGVTAVAFVLSAITILKEKSKMPGSGVLTTGAAFYDTGIVDELNNNGLKFEILDRQ